jgi:predicted ATPase
VKDFPEPVRIFQLGDQAFPPLKTISNTNLPRPVSSFVGREREVAEVVALLREARLVTLTGAPGSGKTRLAIAAAEELVGSFVNGVFWVELATIRDPAVVVPTIAQKLGAYSELATHIGEQEMLLLLDNLEQVIEVAPDLAALVEMCRNVTLLVTSRELLRVRGEDEYEVFPLAPSEAVALFTTRAAPAQLEPSGAVEELCRRLDNLPLALELVAPWAKTLSLRQILKRLGEKLDLFKGGRDVEDRHATLRATFDWAYDLLQTEEKGVFARLGVFVGGSTLEAAQAIADAEPETIRSLVDKNLLRHTGERFWMLETIRDYAADALERSGEREELRERHATWFSELALRAEPELDGVDPETWLDQLEIEHANLAQALAWFSDTQGVEEELRMASALLRYCDLRGYVAEGRKWMVRALEDDAHSEPSELRAKTLGAAAGLASRQGDYMQAKAWHEERLGIGEELGDPDVVAKSRHGIGVAELLSGRYEEAERFLTDSPEVFRELHLERLVRVSTENLGYLELRRGNHDDAEGFFREAMALDEKAGDEPGIAIGKHNLALVALARGDLARSRALEREALSLAGRLGDKENVSYSLEGLAAAFEEEKRERTAKLLGAAAALRESAAFHLQPYEQELHDRTLAAARERLGHEAFTTAWAEGAAMELADAVDYALASAG